MDDLARRTNEYLRNGGLFNPELMDHEKVRDLVIDLAQHIEALEAENARLRMALRRIELINHGPDRASGEYRCIEAAGIAGTALKGTAHD